MPPPNALRTALFAVTLGSVSARAFAQGAADEAARSELVREADAVATADDHGRALDLATRAGAIRMTPSLQLLIAQQQRALHRDLEAYANALACERAAQADAGLRNREDILNTCGALAQALGGSFGRVRVVVSTPAPGVVVRMNGQEVPASAWGVARPVGAGAVTVEARADGYAPWSETLTVAAGQSADATITLTRNPAAPVVPVAPVVPAAPRAGAGPWILVGVGAVSLAAAGVSYGLALGARSDRDALCPRGATGCDPLAQDHDVAYARGLTVTNVTLLAGGALVAGGALWYVLARSRAPERAALTATPALASGGASLVLSGSF